MKKFIQLALFLMFGIPMIALLLLIVTAVMANIAIWSASL